MTAANAASQIIEAGSRACRNTWSLGPISMSLEGSRRTGAPNYEEECTAREMAKEVSRDRCILVTGASGSRIGQMATAIRMREGDAAAFRSALLAWYRLHRRELPWRRTRDPYRIWLSEIM